MEYGIKITTDNNIIKIDNDEHLSFIENRLKYTENKVDMINGVSFYIYEMNDDLLERSDPRKEKKEYKYKLWPYNDLGTRFNNGNVVLGDVLAFFNNIDDFNHYYSFWNRYKIREAYNELERLFKYETINTKRDYINEYGWNEEDYNDKYGKETIFIINCEYIPTNKDNINIHYDLIYSGSVDFNNILENYNLKFDWVDCCSIKVF